jgi:hypothetical protein
LCANEIRENHPAMRRRQAPKTGSGSVPRDGRYDFKFARLSIQPRQQGFRLNTGFTHACTCQAGDAAGGARHRAEPHQFGSGHEAAIPCSCLSTIFSRIQPALAQKGKLLAHDSKTHGGYRLNQRADSRRHCACGTRRALSGGKAPLCETHCEVQSCARLLATKLANCG